MQVGITSPIMEPDVDRELFKTWATEVDKGPFSTYTVGERFAFSNPDVLTVLAASAAWTERVKLSTTVIAAPLHDPVMLAKELASIDLISNGRLSVGVGIGGHLADYTALGVDLSHRTQASLENCVALMRATWAGKTVREGASPVGPFPARAGGLPILAGAMGPKSIRAAARWADANSGWAVNADITDVERSFEVTRTAWREAGRAPPRMITSFWYAVGPNAREQLDLHLRRYVQGVPPEVLAQMGFAGSPVQLKTLLRQIRDLGADEVILATTGADPIQVSRIAEVIDAL